MKKIKLYIAILITSISLISCEDVVNVNLNTAAPKLVIDASIQWQKGTAGSLQKIKLTTTTDFYSNTIPVATGAIVTVTNTTGTTLTVYPASGGAINGLASNAGFTMGTTTIQFIAPSTTQWYTTGATYA